MDTYEVVRESTSGMSQKATFGVWMASGIIYKLQILGKGKGIPENFTLLVVVNLHGAHLHFFKPLSQHCPKTFPCSTCKVYGKTQNVTFPTKWFLFIYLYWYVIKLLGWQEWGKWWKLTPSRGGKSRTIGVQAFSRVF